MENAGLVNHLTPRNRRLLDLVARGFTNQAIADQMTLAAKTVENYLTDLYAELEIDFEDKSINPRVKAAVIYIQGGHQDPLTLWRARYRPPRAALSDADLEDVVGGSNTQEQLLRLVGMAHATV